DSIVRRSALRPPGGQVVIVDVDERSLAAIGQWPWRRDVIGQLIGRLREMGAATIAFDVMFAEPDRQPAPPDAASGARSDDGAHATAGAPRSVDAALAEALRDGGVVVGYALTFDNGGRGRSGCALHPIGLAVVQGPDEHADLPFFRASGAVCSLPGLAQAAGASGFLNASTDLDGILRRMPLLIELDGQIYPGLALAAVIAAK